MLMVKASVSASVTPINAVIKAIEDAESKLQNATHKLIGTETSHANALCQ